MKEPRDDEQPVSREVDEGTDADEARRAILARRARFVALALASAGIAAGCGGETDGDNEQTTGSGGMQATGGEPQVCLSMPITGGTGGQPQVCLGALPPDASVAGGTGGVPQVCLSPPIGGSGGLGPGGAGGGPQVCLEPPLPDAGTDSGDAASTGGTTATGGTGGLPQVCLTPPIDPPEPTDGSA